MARRTYFAFHYQLDIWRVNQVRMHNTTKQDRDEYGFFDGSLWEEEKNNNPTKIKKMIDEKIDGTSVSVILVGAETYARPWVRYEIVKSFATGSGIVGVAIHQQENQKGEKSVKGPNPFEYLEMLISRDGKKIDFYEWVDGTWKVFDKLPSVSTSCDRQHWGKRHRFSEFYKVYDSVDEDAYSNLGKWVEEAAKAVGK